MHAIGIDVGGTTIKGGLVSDEGVLTGWRGIPTPDTPEGVCDVIATLIEAIRAEGDDDGIGVAVPGVIDDRGHVVAVNLGWQDVDFPVLLQERLAEPVCVGHDVRSAARAEQRWGRAQGTAIFLALGTGVAAVTLAGDGILTSGGWGGEIGQTIIVDPVTGRDTPLERVASPVSMGRRYGRPTLDLVAAAATDPVACRILDEGADALAAALAPAVALLTPERIIIVGGISEAGEPYIGRLRDALRRRLGMVPGPEVIPGALGRRAAVLGAGLLVLEQRP